MFFSQKDKNNKYFATKTFTYYIPAPPVRKTGYQEKEFDKLIAQITQEGFEIIDFKVCAHSSDEKSGAWIVCHIGAPTKEIFNRPIEFNSGDQSANFNPSDVPLDPDIIHE